MRDVAKYALLRGKIWQSTAKFVTAAMLVACLSTLAIVPKVFAAEAVWNNSSSISYDSNTYQGATDTTTNTLLGIDTTVQSFTFIDTDPATAGTSQPVNALRQIHVIFFNANADLTTATTANYKTFTYLSAQNFTNPSSVTQITIDPQSLVNATKTAETTSCAIEGGLGWIVCPISNFLAKGMDYIFKILSGFLVVRPVANNTDDALFRAWSYMRNIANVAFVIGFLIVIYSQLTNFGISNYGIKKLLPKIVIAAVLVNVSYYICAIAIDISNILGYSLQDVFLSIRNGLVGSGGNSWDVTSWSSISGFILSGGTVAIAGTTAAVIALSTYGVAGALFLLLPALLSGLVAILVALVIMAGRQALITILVVISPLAFVAYLLPNTEKWFEKWQSTFMQMLILFPAFSVVYGGAQLAASVIIQNADSINTLILGMFVQVAPLFITPLLIKLSGSTLGSLSNMVRKVAKPMTDKSRDWTKERSQNIAARRLAITPRPKQYLARNAIRRDLNRREREAKRTANTGIADARWTNNRRFLKQDQIIREAADSKSLGETNSEANYIASKLVQGSKQQQLDTSLRNAKQEVEDNTHKNTNEYDLFKQKKYQETTEFQSQSPAMQQLIRQAATHAESISVHGIRTKSLQRAAQKEISNTLEKDTAASARLRDIAGVVEIEGEIGAERVRATAIAEQSSFYDQDVKSHVSLFKHQNYTQDELIKLASQGLLRGDAPASDEQLEAGMELVVSTGDKTKIGQIFNYLTTLPQYNDEQRQKKVNMFQALNEKVIKAGRPMGIYGGILGEMSDANISAPFVGTGTADNPDFTPFQTLNIKAIQKGKYSKEAIAKAGERDIHTWIQALNTSLNLPANATEGQGALTDAQKLKFSTAIHEAMTDDQTKHLLKEEDIDKLNTVLKMLDGTIAPQNPATVVPNHELYKDLTRDVT